PETVKQAGDTLKGYQNIWFSIAFVCIGLETNFREIFSAENRKPMYAFLIAQGINVIITLVVALLLFGS
ncbi:MAG: putative sulfate exporter family transporter, partial [Bacteroidales bacterium]